VLYFIDTSRPAGQEEKFIKEILLDVKTPVVKVYTKSDLPTALQYNSTDAHIISSTTKDGYPELLKNINASFF